MADKVVPGPVSSSDTIREAVCINTRKIMDSCRDKDCVEDLRVFPLVSSVPYIANAFSVRSRSATLLYTAVSVKEMSLNRGYYTVDITYFYDVIGETYPANQTVRGLAIFDKRVMLFGSEGKVKSFSSDDCCAPDNFGAMPVAVVDAVDPIALHMNIVETPVSEFCGDQRDIPKNICDMFPEALDLSSNGRQLYVTLGQFSIVRLERDTQLLIPAYDYCMPDKECIGSSEDDPCTMFSRIRFPFDEFFPPDSIEPCEDYNRLV